MDDLISRQAAIDAVEFGITYAKAINKLTGEVKELFKEGNKALNEAVERLQELPSAQPTHNNESNVLKSLDCVRRQDAINLLKKWSGGYDYIETPTDSAVKQFEQLPSAQPTLYGYSIEHLALIARVMQKENVTPEKAIEYFKDIERMGQMIVDEQQEMIRRAVEKWTM